jgi:MFS family permease
LPDDHQRGVWNVSVVALLLTEFCSSAAAFAAVTALGKQVYDLTHSDLDLGLLGLAEFAPAALLVLVTGTVADRYNRAWVAGLSITGMAAVGVGFAVYTANDPTRLGPLFTLVVLFGVARAFLQPALRPLPADIVPPAQLPWLTARFSVTWQLSIIVGPVVAGVAYAIDPVAPYLVMTALLILGAIAVLFVRPGRRRAAVHQASVREAAVDAVIERSGDDTPAAPAGEGLHDALEGLRFIRRSPILLGAISLDLFAVLFGGAVALLPAIAEDRLGVGAIGLGWLRAAQGIGAAAVMLVLTQRPITRHVGRTLLIVVAIFGVFTVVLGATTSFAVAFLAMLILSGADAISVFIRSTLVPLATPRDKRGRVAAVENVFIGASNELGGFESGVAGELLGTSSAVMLGGVATVVVSAIYWFHFPALRRVDRFPDPEGAAPEPSAREARPASVGREEPRHQEPQEQSGG